VFGAITSLASFSKRRASACHCEMIAELRLADGTRADQRRRPTSFQLTVRAFLETKVEGHLVRADGKRCRGMASVVSLSTDRSYRCPATRLWGKQLRLR
jgi:hypothetical protein